MENIKSEKIDDDSADSNSSDNININNVNGNLNNSNNSNGKMEEGMQGGKEQGKEGSDKNTGAVIKRRVAQIVPSALIYLGEYKKQDGWNPNFVEVDGLKIMRVNMIGVVVDKDEGIGYPSITLDDGFATIQVRNFDNTSMFGEIDVGDAVLVIGKPREFSGDKYVLCEIVRKIKNPKWMEYRKKLFNQRFGKLLENFSKEDFMVGNKSGKETDSSVGRAELEQDRSDEVVSESSSSTGMARNQKRGLGLKENKPEEINISEEDVEEKSEKKDKEEDEKDNEDITDNKEDKGLVDEEEDKEIENKRKENIINADKSNKKDGKDKQNNKPSTEIVFEIIKELDDGDGASVEEIVERADIEDAESVVEKLIREGEIFKSSPGKVKIL
jgi:RPA family protein